MKLFLGLLAVLLALSGPLVRAAANDWPEGSRAYESVAPTDGIPEEDVAVAPEILSLMADADVAKHVALMVVRHDGFLKRVTVFRRSPHRLLYRLYFGDKNAEDKTAEDKTAEDKTVGYFEVFVIPSDDGERPRVGQAGDPVLTP